MIMVPHGFPVRNDNHIMRGIAKYMSALPIYAVAGILGGYVVKRLDPTTLRLLTIGAFFVDKIIQPATQQIMHWIRRSELKELDPLTRAFPIALSSIVIYCATTAIRSDITFSELVTWKVTASIVASAFVLLVELGALNDDLPNAFKACETEVGSLDVIPIPEAVVVDPTSPMDSST